MLRDALALVALVLGLSVVPASAQPDANPTAVKPFKIIGNIYYVGTTDPTAFLITTPAGHILIDSTYDNTAPIVLDSIRALGFKLSDVKIMLSSHAHFDHVGGHAAIKRATGAQVYATAADADALESGDKTSFHQTGPFEAVKVDRRLKDGEPVQLGGVTLTPHVAAGHTKGNTAWTMTVEDGGKSYNVVFAPSMSINPGVHMVNYKPFPDIADAYARSFAMLHKLPCDVFLGPHAGFFDLAGKMSRLGTAGAANPFIDTAGYHAFLSRLEKDYRQQIEKERAAK